MINLLPASESQTLRGQFLKTYLFHPFPRNLQARLATNEAKGFAVLLWTPCSAHWKHEKPALSTEWT